MNALTNESAPVAAPAGNGLALVTLIAGLLGLASAAVFFFTDVGPEFLIIGLVLGLLALILGIIAVRKRQSKGLAVTGLVAGIVTILLAGAIYLFALIFIGAILA